MPDPVVTPVEPAAVVPVLPSDQDGAQLLANKFKTPEELAKGYSNLATLLGKQGKLTDEQVKQVLALAPDPAVVAVVPAAVEPAAKKDPLTIDPDATADQVVTQAGLKMDELRAEFAETGALTEVSYAKLAKAGITKDVVDTYIAGQNALRDQTEQKAYTSVGGEEKYKQMLGWAATGLSKDEKIAFNAAVTGTPAASALAIAGLKARFESANGSDPNLVQGDGGPGDGSGYKSRQEVTADMKDPRYKKDPAYRAAVHAKLARSRK
jgi:hypothetical protein